MTPDSVESMGTQAVVRLTAIVHGHVQGVGFRWFVQSQARPRNLVGHACNEPDGTVRVVAEGNREHLGQLIGTIRGGAGPGHVTKVETEITDATGEYQGFGIS